MTTALAAGVFPGAPAGPGRPPLAGMPAAAAPGTAVPAGEVTAFDDVFRQLTGALLSTVAGDGKAATGGATPTAGTSSDDPGAAPGADVTTPAFVADVAPQPLPIVVPVAPAELTVAVEPGPAEAAPPGASWLQDGVPAGAARRVGTGVPAGFSGALDRGAKAGALAAHLPVAMPASGRATPYQVAEFEDGPVPPPARQTPAAKGGLPALAVAPGVPAAPSAPQGRPVSLSAERAASAAGLEDAPAGVAPAASAPVTPAGGTEVVPGLTVRAEALQRAIGRRADADHGEGAPAGLAVAAARAAVAEVMAGGTADTGTSDAHESPGQSPQPRPARVTGAAGTAAAAVANGTPAVPRTETAVEHASTPAPTAGAAQRLAAVAASLEEPAARSAEGPRAAGPTSGPLVGPGADVPATRELPARLVEVAPSTPIETAGADPVHAQIVKSLRLQWTGGAGEARIALKPEYLGDVVASIKVEAGVVTATLHAETADVRRLLEAQTASLREALAEHGLKLDRLVVAEPETPAGANGDRRSRGRQPQPPPQSRPRRRQPGDDATFDLTTE